MCKKTMYLLAAVFAVSIAYPVIYISGLQGSNSTSLQHMEYTEEFEVSGVIEPDSVVCVALAYPVYVKKVYVQKNSYVNKGQLILTLDKQKMQDALQSSNYASGSDNGSIPTLATANGNEEQFNAIPQEIYASEGGLVSELNALEGGLVMSGTPLLTISKSDKNIFKVTISQESYKRINVGDGLKVCSQIYPEHWYDAVITDRYAVIRKESTVLGNKTVVDIFAQITNPDEYITQGVTLNGRIIKDGQRRVAFLPYEFIHQDKNGEYVIVLRNGFSTKVYIKTGQEFEEGIEVLTAFRDGEIFLENNSLKKDKTILIE